MKTGCFAKDESWLFSGQPVVYEKYSTIFYSLHYGAFYVKIDWIRFVRVKMGYDIDE